MSIWSAWWSWTLAGIGITALLIAATRPRVGWVAAIGVQALWVAYAVVTRQWGFIVSAAAYTVGYARLLRSAQRADRPPGHTDTEMLGAEGTVRAAALHDLLAALADRDGFEKWADANGHACRYLDEWDPTSDVVADYLTARFKASDG